MTLITPETPQFDEAEHPPEPQPPKPGKPWRSLLLSVLVLGGGITAWQLLKQSETTPAMSNIQEPPPRPVTTVSLTTGEAVQRLNLIGQVEASEQATVRTRVDGVVQNILVKVGDRIQPGQTLAVLDSADQALTVKQAEARLATERSRLAELEEGTRSEILAQRQAQLRSAITREQEARDYLQRTKELAPKLIAQREAELKAAIAREQEAQRNLQPTEELAPKRIAQREAELKAAIAREQEAKDNLDRISSLVEEGVQSQRALVEAQAAIDEAVGERLAAEAELTATESENQQDIIVAQTALNAAEGERLRAEATLTATATETQRTIAGAQAALDAAIEEKLRVEAELAEAQAGPRPEEIAAQRSVVAAAEAAVNQAKLALQRTTITASSGGVVRSRSASVGDYVENSDPLLTYVSGENLDIFLEVPEASSGQVRPGMEVELVARALPQWRQKAVIAAIVPATNTTSRRQLVRVSLSDPPTELLTGMAVLGQVEIPVETANSDSSFLVPRDALVRRGDQWLVFGVENNQAQQFEVELLADLGEEVVISDEQLRSGQSIVVRGGDSLREGSPVTTVDSTAE